LFGDVTPTWLIVTGLIISERADRLSAALVKLLDRTRGLVAEMTLDILGGPQDLAVQHNRSTNHILGGKTEALHEIV
jgi:hypothetical protein